ncbi:MAG: cytochrome c biogenesis protein CcsA [Flavobacteriaceae bacterium]|nr:cytochrome c biogenesis protein CcsA [Flavobacteriaceae bacterium]
MKKLINLIISSKATLILLIIFTIAIAAATFVEDSYDTITAKLLIYNAKWFEFLLFLLAVNFIGSIKKYHLYRIGRWTGLLFHSAFIVVIIGAGVTRYIGFEGSMHIREGESSNIMVSSDPYLIVNAVENKLNYKVDRLINFSAITDNYFNVEIETNEKSKIEVSYKDYLKNATETYLESDQKGIKVIELTVSVDGHKDIILIKDGEIKETHGHFFAYNNYDREDAVILISNNGKTLISYPGAIKTSKMPELTIGEIPKDSIGELKPKYLYEPLETGIGFVLTKMYNNAKIKYVAGNDEARGPDVLLVNLSVNGKDKEVAILGGRGYVNNFQKVNIDGIDIAMSYGMKQIELPFSLHLNKFILERYAGSDSPSSYASEVTLIDKNKGLSEDHRIYMNNVLDYKGYRFFQSSYDKDEKGTVLSVNHDFYGTWISYIGYLLMGLGFIATLFNKNSRYHELIHKIKNTRAKRKSLIATMIFGIIFVGNTYSQDNNTNHIHNVDQNSVGVVHAKKFGNLLVQNYSGRFVPINTLAYDVMHKISRKDNFDIPTKGKMDAMQVFMDIILNAEFWKQQKIIYVREQAVMNIIGAEGKYASFNDFFNEKGDYKLRSVAEPAFRKKPTEQNVFDKEIIKINERVEIFMLGFQGKLLNIFPDQESSNNKWINWMDPIAKNPLKGSIKILNDDLQLKEFNYNNLFKKYLTEVFQATKSGDYTRANKILGYLDNIQRQSDSALILPSKSKVDKEIQYTKAKIFINLKNIYALLSVILLVLAFIDNLKDKKSKILSYTLNFFILLLGIAFIYHTYGMALRWYLSGHAPWSNGYEALILVSWGSLLAGFSFIRYSKITLAATALLAFFTLMTASHSSYDPQLTNLQPVLKSYWLIIHVATLTISYGFLGLGFVLGLMNMTLYLIKNKKNGKRINLIIKELTQINEMNITIGLFLATVGTFLGGIWANESWGRYWGWDAKETWALVIVMAYTIILHFRLVPKMKSLYIFNVGSIISFASVLMTFFGVNYYLSKGLHSYASGETPVFPIWAWITILLLLILIIAAGIKSKKTNHKVN